MTLANRLAERIKRHTDSSQPAVSAGDIRELLREHAELVEALTLARIYIAAAVQEGRVFGRRDLVAVDKVLAKIGGDA